MRKAVVKDGKVINVILAPEGFTLPDCELITLADNSLVDQRWTYEKGEFIKPPEPEPEPEPIPEPKKSDLELRIEALEAELSKLSTAKTEG